MAWSGRFPPRRRTATSPPCLPCTAAHTSTALPIPTRTTSRKTYRRPLVAMARRIRNPPAIRRLEHGACSSDPHGRRHAPAASTRGGSGRVHREAGDVDLPRLRGDVLHGTHRDV